MVGVVEDMSRSTGLGFTKEDDVILLLGNTTADMHSSEYIKAIHGIAVSAAPHFELQEEVNLQHAVRGAYQKKLVHSAHDISEGGLFCTLLKRPWPGGMGFSVKLTVPSTQGCFPVQGRTKPE